MVNDIIRALRLPFIAASSLPFIFGSLIARNNFNGTGFLLGLVAAASAHLSANLINDYADSKSGADWQDIKFYPFFGGSKLIQEGTLTEKFYLKLAVSLALISSLSVISLALVIKSASVIMYFLAIILMGWSYSAKPLRFSYRRLGEVIIFILFGPALVMSGYFIQTRIFPDIKSFVLSLPFGFFTTAILFANEIPDYTEDEKAGKHTWVSFLGPARSFIIYLSLIFLGFSAIGLAIYLGYLSKIAAVSFIFIYLAVKSANILKKFPGEKLRLMESSGLTIALQSFVSIALILDILLCIK